VNANANSNDKNGAKEPSQTLVALLYEDNRNRTMGKMLQLRDWLTGY